jgi:bifunctional non-homologous end joining protein LigD
MFRHACKLGLEGIDCKRCDSSYQSDRSKTWLKVKNPAARGG